jgi:hypothetical protein
MILATIAPGAAQSALIPVSQDRYVEATAIAAAPFTIDEDDAAAADFGSFVAMVDPQAVAVSGSTFATAQAIASQSSSIGANTVLAQGEASLSLTLPSSGAGASAAGDADSFFELLFMVDVLSSFVLNGSVDTQAIVTGGASLPALSNLVILEDLDNASILFSTLTDDEAFSLSGVLNAGTAYRLRSSAGIDGNQQTSNTQDRTVFGLTSFDLDLQLTPRTVPEPGTFFLLLGGLAASAFVRRRRMATPAARRAPARPAR